VLGAALAAPASGQGTGSAKPPGISIDQVRRSIGTTTRPDSTRTEQAEIRLVPARAVRVPGARFALGDSLEHLVQRLGLSPDGSAAVGPDERVFTGAIEYFGQTARARFRFQGRWLARAEIETDAVSERVRDYILDEYQRQGYQRTCRTIAARKMDCRWSGRTIVEMVIDTSGVHADVTLPDQAMVPVTEVPPLVEVDGGDPAGPETLMVAKFATPGRHEAIVLDLDPVGWSVVAGDADDQVAAWVLASVNPAGTVVDARLVGDEGVGVGEYALAAVRQWRFQPHKHDGRAVGFWVQIPLKN